jgi:predicted transcriptional regulator
MDVFAVRLPRELKAALQSRARAEDREMGQLVREALAAYLGG